jgi:hypothetical protein
VKGSVVLCCRGIAAAAACSRSLLQGSADESTVAREASAKAQNGGEVRQVWGAVRADRLLSGQWNTGDHGFDVICEPGKLSRVSEGFETSSGPKFGEGWVVAHADGIDAGRCTGTTAAGARRRLRDLNVLLGFAGKKVLGGRPSAA